jgi:hypothetical protein
MGLDAHFESPPGSPWSSLRFAKGQQIRIAGSMIDILLVPLYGIPVMVTIYGANGAVDLAGQDYVDFLGHWYVDAVLPNIDATAVVTVQEGGGAIGKFDPVIFNIGIGNALPEPPPNPDGGVQWWQWLLVGGGVAIVAAAVLPRLIPQTQIIRQITGIGKKNG